MQLNPDGKKSDRKISPFLVLRFWNWIMCQTIAYDQNKFSSWVYNWFKRYEGSK